jgi:hypothetical protein
MGRYDDYAADMVWNETNDTTAVWQLFPNWWME